MFSCNIHLLPSFYTYEAVVDWWHKVPQSRRKHWEPDERPLDGPAKHHYRIKKSGDTYQIILYQTPIVTWEGANRVIVDVSHGGSTTMQFADRYCGFLGCAFKEGGQDVFRVDDVKYKTTSPFLFELQHGPDNRMPAVLEGHMKPVQQGRPWWKLMSSHDKITRQVLDPDKAHEYRQAAAPFKKWVRGVWALSNDEPDGVNHPWVGQQWDEWRPHKDEVLAALARQEDWPRLVIRFCNKDATWNQKSLFWAKETSVANLLKNMNEYMQQGMHITIPYDAPLPKRSKK